MEGLINIAILGTTMELSWLLDPRTYRQLNESEIQDFHRHTQHRAFTIRAYLKFITIFNDRQVVRVNGKSCEPLTAIFDYIFHKFAISLYKYKLRQATLTPGFCEPVELRHNLLEHIARFRPTLKQDVERDMGIMAKNLEVCQTFAWSGPNFSVLPRPNGDVSTTGIFHLLTNSVV